MPALLRLEKSAPQPPAVITGKGCGDVNLRDDAIDAGQRVRSMPVRRRDQVYLWLRDHPLVVDSFLAGSLFFVLGFAGWPVFFDPYALSLSGDMVMPSVTFGLNQALYAVGTPLVSAGLILPLALRRVRPEWTGVLVFGTAFLQWLLAIPIQASQVGVLIALHALAAYGRRGAARTGLVVSLAAAPLAAARYVITFDTAVPVTIGVVALVLAAWAVGDLQRVRRQQLDGLREHAHRLEVEREQEARLAAADERARIAREMHDVVAHSLSVVIAQADGGRYAANDDPNAAVRACTTISETGRSALTEMRRLLGVLRTDDGDVRAPAPGLANLDDLVAGVRDSGLPVHFTTTGAVRPVSSGVELAVYRIIQEALTNVLKHAGPEATAEVRMDWTPAGLMLSIADDGRGAAADSALRNEDSGAGNGIPGMSERAALYGGKLRAGPVPGGGFVVRARIPYLATETMQQ
jgi:signal transduction histidine kinase